MEIAAGRCKLRAWRPGDEPSLSRYANNRKVWINLRDVFPHPYSVVHAAAWVESVKGLAPLTPSRLSTPMRLSEALDSRSWTTSTDGPPTSGSGSANLIGAKASRQAPFES